MLDRHGTERRSGGGAAGARVRWVPALAVAALMGVAPVLGAGPQAPSPAAMAGGEAGGRQQAGELTRQARRLDRIFRAAAEEFGVPVELLQAIAFTESRWQMRPADPEPNELGMPPSYGVMGLRDDEHFGHSLREAAALLGSAAEELKRDVRLNVRGAAALLAHHAAGQGVARLEDWEPAVARLSGIPQPEVARVHTYEVFNSIRLGRAGKDYRVQQREVDLERIYGAQELRRLSAPTMDASELGDPTANESADYPPAQWVPAAGCNYTAGRSSAITHVAIHIAEGTYAGTISWFSSCNPPRVSAHYVIRSSDGQVTQMVRESDTAHHVANHNSYSVGIEHEGWASDCNWYSTAMYDASAALVKDIADSHGIPRTAVYDGSLGWDTEIARESHFKIKGHTNFPTTKSCPGACWNWERFWSLVTSCVAVQTPTGLWPDNWVSAPANPVTMSYNANGWRWYTLAFYYWNGSKWVYLNSLVVWGNRPQINFSRGWYYAWAATQWDGCRYGPWSAWAYFWAG